MKTWNDLLPLHSFHTTEIGQHVRVELEGGDEYKGEVVNKVWQGFVLGHLVEIKYKPELEAGTVIVPVSEIIQWEKVTREFESGQLSLFDIQKTFVFLGIM